MPAFPALRARLPSLYRPQDDDAAGPPLALAPGDVVEVRAAPDGPPLAVERSASGPATVLLTLDGPSPVREVRLAAGRAPGITHALELYRVLSGGGLARTPSVVAAVRDDVARVEQPFRGAAFGVRLRRRGLLTLLLLALGDALDAAGEDGSAVLGAHWFDHADRAIYSPWFIRGRQLSGLAPALATDPEARRFPYLHDLARLGSLMSVTPWAEGERVEPYRRRLARTVSLYGNGLATRPALRAMVAIQLPVDPDADPGMGERPFTLEEFSPLGVEKLAVTGSGEPTDLVGPLMRWTVRSDGLEPAPPTVYVQGVEPVVHGGDPPRGGVEATDRPLLELLSGPGGRKRIGLAYRRTLAPGQTLRLRPGFSSWTAGDDGVRRARSAPGEDHPADPTAPGPWAEESGGPPGPVHALVQAGEGSLWAGTAAGALWRRDGGGWSEAVAGLGAVHCLAVDGHRLLAGTAGGLVAVALHPPDGEPLQADEELGGTAIHAILRDRAGRWWLASDHGLLRRGLDAPPAGPPDPARAARALAEDGTGSLFAGGAFGLLQFQPETGRWYFFSGESASDQVPDWRPLEGAEGPVPPPEMPPPGSVFLPPVRAIRRGPDASLWLGTERGIARYRARAERGGGRGGRATRPGGHLTYTTRLEALPDLGDGVVSAIVEDARQNVWFLTASGLLRFDGRLLHQHPAGGDSLALGDPDLLHPGGGGEPEDRGAWRFDRDGGRWQRVAPAGRAFVAFTGPVRAAPEPAVHALALTDDAHADVLEGWDPADGTFAATAPVDPGDLVVRYKPSEERVVDGGLAALPRVPAGESTWRYLSLEPEDDEEPEQRPAWTVEGRLLPPPAGAEPPFPGRYDREGPRPGPGEGHFDEAVFAFPPAARVWMEWSPRRPLSVLARLEGGEPLEPAVLDRVWEGLRRVRPAGVRAALAIDDDIVRRDGHGPG